MVLTKDHVEMKRTRVQRARVLCFLAGQDDACTVEDIARNVPEIGEKAVVARLIDLMETGLVKRSDPHVQGNIYVGRYVAR